MSPTTANSLRSIAVQAGLMAVLLGCVDRPPPGVRPSATRAKFAEEFELEEAAMAAAEQAQRAPRPITFSADLVLAEGTGHNWIKLLVDQKLDVAELMHFQTGKHSQLIYFRFLEDYYANPAMLDRKLGDFALITAAIPLFEDDSTQKMIDEARQREKEQAAQVKARPESRYRTWSGAGGKGEVSAAFVKEIGGIVYLKRQRDGQEIRVKLEDLSQPDQNYVQRQAENDQGPMTNDQ